jgi:hypothetical protein
MKISKIALASIVAFAFLAAGCAGENKPVVDQDQKETSAKSTNAYSSKLGVQSTKKDIKK